MRIRVWSVRETLVVMFVSLLVATELWTARWIHAARNALAPSSNDPPSIQQRQEQQQAIWNLPVPSNRTEIRRWGCNLTQTPLIFVHIGKSGGGSVGTRIAASSLNYTKEKARQADDSYYPLPNNNKARFIASTFATHLPSHERTYEGTTPCHASTPLGQAIGCPELLSRLRRFQDRRHGECNPDSKTCHLVYMGHNFFGSEMHWLPVEYLKQWWASLSGNDGEDDAISPLWDRIQPNGTWCVSKNQHRPDKFNQYRKMYEACSIPLQRQADTKAIHALSNHLSSNGVITSWSPLYASLPVLRVTVMRDPFSWLMSKYFWHLTKEDRARNATCDNIKNGLFNAGLARPHELDMDNSGPGWISRMALGCIMYLCGEDCIVRYAAGTATLHDLEVQAEGNLRQAFAVVGILEEVDTFYEMLTARVQYMDTSLNPQVKGSTHRTGRSKESNRCRSRFQEPGFQAKLLELSPELRILNRLYQVAKEVNRFQLQELRECSASSNEAS